MPSSPVAVALVEDEAEVRECFERAIAANPQLRLLQACSTGAAMQQWLAAHPVDVLLVDLGLPDVPGLEVIRHARRVQPACSVMVISAFADAAHMVPAFEAGACGYLVKDGTEDELARHVLDLHAGGSPMSPIIARQLLLRWQGPAPRAGKARAPAGADELSPREREVLRLVARGCSYQEAGACLGITTATVQAHVRNLYAKLEVHSKTEAVFEARQLGLLDWA
ncbi:response regulator transcription factor [Pseudorhodoferax sp.]|uniref:response regulator transcription factor n=1 Tax=Pseudorhodoferax sp. TaxID=1993553 RepID=UPI002DD69B11|nr:response regulator transcription factor [Pseudorhodoferax sp.]